MTTYYVKPAGNDGLDGLSLPNAWATLSKAATTAVAGDTVNFDDGTYLVGQGQSSWNTGTSGNPVTFQAINRRLAIWKKSANDDALVDWSGYNYMVLSGLVIDGDWAANNWSMWRMIELDSSDNITISDCEIQDSTCRCIYLNSDCTNILIENCDIHQDTYEDGESNDGILVWFANNADITIRNCTIYNIDHVGIYINGGTNVLVDNCTVHTTHSHLVQYGSPGGGNGWPIDGTIENCMLYGSEDYGPEDPEKHNGIYITGGDVDDVTIQLNDIYDTDSFAIQIGANVAGPIRIYNNTMYDFNRQLSAIVAGIQLNEGSAGISVEVKNNIFYSTRAAGLVYRISGAHMNAGLDSDYNLFYADGGAVDDIYRNGVTYATFALYQAVFSPNAVIDDDPDFTNAGAGDFTLQDVSPAIDAGVDVGLPYNMPAPDIGAHEYEGEPPEPPEAGDATVTLTYQVKYASLD